MSIERAPVGAGCPAAAVACDEVPRSYLFHLERDDEQDFGPGVLLRDEAEIAGQYERGYAVQRFVDEVVRTYVSPWVECDGGASKAAGRWERVW